MTKKSLPDDAAVSATWYVLAISASGRSVFATMGPYPREGAAWDAADAARVVHFRVGEAGRGRALSDVRRSGRRSILERAPGRR